ncbi:MAG TPA: hypothetical protein VKU80_11040 [Planctomycetota bacterium]|nr:hypothetical protein [Planctomycetota bacterium]
MVACWLGALLPQRRSTANLLRNPGLPIPRTGRATFLGLILFEIASFFTLNIRQGGDFPIPIAILALNLEIAIWVALSGLCFLVIRIPFSWKLWLGVVIGMAGSLIALFFEVLCLLYSGG